jgi:hypothetical protein
MPPRKYHFSVEEIRNQRSISLEEDGELDTPHEKHNQRDNKNEDDNSTSKHVNCLFIVWGLEESIVWDS